MQESDNQPIENQLTRQANWLGAASGISVVAGVASALLGGLLEKLDLSDTGRALSMVGVIGSLTIAAIMGFTGVLLRWLGTRMSKTIAEVERRGLLAKWTIPKEEWNAFAWEQRRKLRAKIDSVLWGLFFASVLIGGITTALAGDWVWLKICAASGVGTALTGLTLRWLIRANKYPMSKSDAVIAFAPEMLRVASNTYLWKHFNPKLESVALNAEGQLHFAYSGENDEIPIRDDFVVPVPPDCEADALRIIESLSRHWRLPGAAAT